MQRPPKQLTEFLYAIDSELDTPQTLLIIGGAAAALAYGATRPTADIDTIRRISPQLQAAVEVATEKTSLEIPVNYVGTYDAPYDFEERLQILEMKGFNMLTIKLPERHDLALMKIVRGEEHDFQVIKQMHNVRELELEILSSRFTSMLAHVIGQPKWIAVSFVVLIEEIFGEKAGANVEGQLARFLS